MKTQKLTTDQLREAHVRMQGQAETERQIKDRTVEALSRQRFVEALITGDEAEIQRLKPVMDIEDEIARLKARIAELETDNLNLIDQLRGQK